MVISNNPCQLFFLNKIKQIIPQWNEKCIKVVFQMTTQIQNREKILIFFPCNMCISWALGGEEMHLFIMGTHKVMKHVVEIFWY